MFSLSYRTRSRKRNERRELAAEEGYEAQYLRSELLYISQERFSGQNLRSFSFQLLALRMCRGSHNDQTDYGSQDMPLLRELNPNCIQLKLAWRLCREQEVFELKSWCSSQLPSRHCRIPDELDIRHSWDILPWLLDIYLSSIKVDDPILYTYSTPEGDNNSIVFRRISCESEDIQDGVVESFGLCY